jgi:hypothetical protein
MTHRKSAEELFAAVVVLPLFAIGATPPALAATATIAAGAISRSRTPGNRPAPDGGSDLERHQAGQGPLLGDEQYHHGEYAQFLNSYHPTWGILNTISADPRKP